MLSSVKEFDTIVAALRERGPSTGHAGAEWDEFSIAVPSGPIEHW
jgi:hypothetical protein